MDKAQHIYQLDPQNPPVPIPNTEVKHRSGEGIQFVGENSELLGFFFLSPFFEVIISL